MKTVSTEPARGATVAVMAPTLTEGIMDKGRYAERWSFSRRHVDNLIAMGLPHLKIGQRQVRIIVEEADAWMREKFATRRNGKLPTAA